MVITQEASLSHWNYFIALESDLAQVSRFVEFSKENFLTYSIELAHLLLTAASEVDVVVNQHCSVVAPSEKAGGMDAYRKVLRKFEPNMESTKIFLPRYSLEFTPWENWQNDKTPDWWSDHNKVKHQRGDHFARANLQNALNAMGGLFIALIFFYRGRVKDGWLFPPPMLFAAPPELIERVHTFDGETGLHYKTAS
jgi:hypothetical protein